MRFNIVISAALLLAGVTNAVVPSAVAAPPTALSSGKLAFLQKKYAAAAKNLKIACDSNPANAESRLLYGKTLLALSRTTSDIKARETGMRNAASELRQALRLGRGSKISLEANSILSGLPATVKAPRLDRKLSSASRSRSRAAGEVLKPRVLEFYAAWADSCKQLKPVLEKIKTEYGDKVEFVSYNVDDPDTTSVFEFYEVSPIPTVIFLDANDDVISYSAGFAGDAALRNAMKKLVPQS